ncbi:MAG: glycosyltransferase [Bacteroidales bacterium]|nr:glycosyltransferase [Bacteroidales bacterium]
MRICCVIASLRLGGAERQLAGLAVLLKNAGHDVEVLSYRDGSFYAEELKTADVKHYRIPSKGGTPAIVRRIVNHIRENGTEVVISFLVGANIKCCLAHMVYPRFRLVVSERNCNTTLLPHDLFRFSLFRAHADAVVCNSFAQTAFVSRHCPGLRLKLETIPNFVDSTKFAPASTARSKAGGEPMELVTVARLRPRKNALRFIRAVSDPSLAGIHVDWYGAKAGCRYSARCERLIRKLGMEGRFTIHQACHDSAGVYRSADAFCLPSFYEGTPNALAEALTTGLPAICSDVSDNARYVIPGRNGFLFNPHSRKSMVKALRRLLELSSADLADYGSQSLAIAADNFHKDLFIKRYLELLRGLEGGKNRKS